LLKWSRAESVEEVGVTAIVNAATGFARAHRVLVAFLFSTVVTLAVAGPLIVRAF